MQKLLTILIVLALIVSLFIGCGEPKEPTEITARHILIMYEGAAAASAEITRTKEEAQAFAEKVLQMVKDGGDFAELAKQYSDGPTKVRGGLLTPFGRGKMSKNFEDAAFALKKGEVSGVVETEFGFHIIKREK